MSTSRFERLSGRRKAVVVLVPLATALLCMAFGGYYVASLIAPLVGIDMGMPLAAQSGGQRFFAIYLALFVFIFIVVNVAVYKVLLWMLER
jgi:hypothetical protein